VSDERTVTTVEIAGEEYTLRSEASQEYTLECARLVNETIAQIMSRASLVEAHKAAILAALALADQLIQARSDAEAVQQELAGRSLRLVAELESRLGGSDLASPD
jgi:cell division protein ZapA (FtsZ GTPase activity inhibitor)